MFSPIFLSVVLSVALVTVCAQQIHVDLVRIPRSETREWLKEHRLNVLNVEDTSNPDYVVFAIRSTAPGTSSAGLPPIVRPSFSAAGISQLYHLMLWRTLDLATERRWSHALAGDSSFAVVRRHPEDPSVMVKVGRQQTLDYLADQSNDVRLIEVWSPPQLHDAYINFRVQSNRKAVCNVSSPYLGCTPLWDSGLFGQGQVVGVGDSGVYLRHCLFNDETCGSSTIDSPEPACGGGNYLEPPCSSCVPYCISGDGVSCAPPNSPHRTCDAYRSLSGGGDFDDRQVGHGTAVAGLIVGAPQSVGSVNQFLAREQGVAPRARLVIHDMSLDTSGNAGVSVPTPFDTAYLPWFHANGARITTNSWGSAPSSGYNSASQAIDRFVFQHPDHLVIFSAGNSGDRDTMAILLQLGPEAAAKNSLTVGATMTDLESMLRFGAFAQQEGIDGQSNATRWGPDFLASFSSAGPTLDRRIKPELCAPGQLTLTALASSFRENDADGSCLWPESLAGWSGTSFSAPVMAGYAALVREWMQTQKGVASPSAALMKAALITAAQPLLGINFYADGNRFLEVGEIPRPEWAWGYGRPILEKLVDSPGKTFLSNDAEEFTEAGDNATLCVSFQVSPQTVAPLVATLAWTDPPGSLSGNQFTTKLVNDIDLSMVTAQCGIHYGNGRQESDRLNNVERVELSVGNSLNVPLEMEFVVVIAGARVVTGSQRWSLVIHTPEGEIDSVVAATQSSQCAAILVDCASQIQSLISEQEVEVPPPEDIEPPAPSSGTGRLIVGTLGLLTIASLMNL